MSVIENFAELSAKEQLEFATALLKTINSEGMFSSETKFEVTNVSADDFTGSLMVEVSQTNPIDVPRHAFWTCDTEEDATDDPGFEANYEEYIVKDAANAFKTLSTVIDDYKVSLEVSDVTEDETVDIEVENISHEDDGIGDYEYFGFRGNDSNPYVSVEGTIVKSCECSLAFFVEPNDEPTEPVDITED